MKPVSEALVEVLCFNAYDKPFETAELLHLISLLPMETISESKRYELAIVSLFIAYKTVGTDTVPLDYLVKICSQCGCVYIHKLLDSFFVYSAFVDSSRQSSIKEAQKTFKTLCQNKPVTDSCCCKDYPNSDTTKVSFIWSLLATTRSMCSVWRGNTKDCLNEPLHAVIDEARSHNDLSLFVFFCLPFFSVEFTLLEQIPRCFKSVFEAYPSEAFGFYPIIYHSLHNKDITKTCLLPFFILFFNHLLLV